VSLDFLKFALTSATFDHKGVDAMFHATLEKRSFDPFISFLKA
jgi:hypothetical protein